jgi:predicted HD superfamily hydrolase involved in NAD metabolism
MFPREAAMMSLFNAVSFVVTRAEGQYTARTLEENSDVINACVDPVPYIPTLHKDIFANYFPAPGNDKVLYGVYNRSGKAVKAEVLEVDDIPGFHYVELWADKEVTMHKVNGKVRLTVELDADTAGNIVRLPELLKAEIRSDGMIHITIGSKDKKYDACEVKIAYDEDKFDDCKKYKIELTDVEKRNPFLIHSKLGAVYANKLYGIDDEEVISAIRFHTTGKPDMTLLEKIIFIADYIEPGRDKAPNLKEIRQMAFIDIDEAMYMILKDTLDYLDKGEGEKDELTKDTFLFYKEIHDKKENN